MKSAVSGSTWGASLKSILEIDARSLAAFRIALGLIVLADLINRAPLIGIFYTDAGVLPGDYFLPAFQSLSLCFLNTSYAFQVLLFVLSATAAGMLVLGYRTRIASIACYVLVTSLHVRACYSLDGGDNFVRASLMLGCFLPWGSAFSADARAGRTRTPGRPAFSVASVAVLAHFAFVYASAGFSKQGPEWHETGRAIFMALSQEYWARPLGEFLTHYPGFLKAMTSTVVLFQVTAPFLLFLPFRTGQVRLVLIAAFWFFEISLALSIQLHLFPFAMVAGTLVFLPSSIWNRLGRRFRVLSVDRQVKGGTSGDLKWLDRAGNVVVAGIVALWIVTTVSRYRATDNRIVYPVPFMLGMTPGYDVYTLPPTKSVRLEVRARLRDGSEHLILKVPDSNPSSRLAERHQWFRLKMYLRNISTPEFRGEIPAHYMQWVGRTWNAANPPEKAVALLQLVQFNTDILQPAGPVPVLVSEISSFPEQRP